MSSAGLVDDLSVFYGQCQVTKFSACDCFVFSSGLLFLALYAMVSMPCLIDMASGRRGEAAVPTTGTECTLATMLLFWFYGHGEF